MSNPYRHPITRALKPVLHGICRDSLRLKISESLTPNHLAISVVAALDDYRILVGKGGRNINAIQRIVRWAGEQTGLGQAHFELQCENLDAIGHAFHEFAFNPDFDEVLFLNLLKDVCAAVGIDASRSVIQLDPDRKVRVFVPARNLTEQELLADISLLFYSLGFRMGRKIDLKAVNDSQT